MYSDVLPLTPCFFIVPGHAHTWDTGCGMPWSVFVPFSCNHQPAKPEDCSVESLCREQGDHKSCHRKAGCQKSQAGVVTVVYVLHPWTGSSSPGHACRGTCSSVRVSTNTHPTLFPGLSESRCVMGLAAGCGVQEQEQGRVGECRGNNQGAVLDVKPWAANQETDGVGGTFSMLWKGTSQHVPTGSTGAARGGQGYQSKQETGKAASR